MCTCAAHASLKREIAKGTFTMELSSIMAVVWSTTQIAISQIATSQTAISQIATFTVTLTRTLASLSLAPELQPETATALSFELQTSLST